MRKYVGVPVKTGTSFIWRRAFDILSNADKNWEPGWLAGVHQLLGLDPQAS